MFALQFQVPKIKYCQVTLNVIVASLLDTAVWVACGSVHDVPLLEYPHAKWVNEPRTRIVLTEVALENFTMTIESYIETVVPVLPSVTAEVVE